MINLCFAEIGIGSAIRLESRMLVLPSRNNERVQIKAQWTILGWILIEGEEIEENEKEREHLSECLDCDMYVCQLLRVKTTSWSIQYATVMSHGYDKGSIVS